MSNTALKKVLYKRLKKKFFCVKMLHEFSKTSFATETLIFFVKPSTTSNHGFANQSINGGAYLNCLSDSNLLNSFHDTRFAYLRRLAISQAFWYITCLHVKINTADMVCTLTMCLCMHTKVHTSITYSIDFMMSDIA